MDGPALGEAASQAGRARTRSSELSLLAEGLNSEAAIDSDRLKFRGVLGTGAFATVRAAELRPPPGGNPRSDCGGAAAPRQVAVKTLHCRLHNAQEIELFMHEAELLRTLRHRCAGRANPDAQRRCCWRYDFFCMHHNSSRPCAGISRASWAAAGTVLPLRTRHGRRLAQKGGLSAQHTVQRRCWPPASRPAASVSSTSRSSVRDWRLAYGLLAQQRGRQGSSRKGQSCPSAPKPSRHLLTHTQPCRRLPAGSGGSLGDLVRRQMIRPYKPLYRLGSSPRVAAAPMWSLRGLPAGLALPLPGRSPA